MGRMDSIDEARARRDAELAWLETMPTKQLADLAMFWFTENAPPEHVDAFLAYASPDFDSYLRGMRDE